jgi:hypothetical protein
MVVIRLTCSGTSRLEILFSRDLRDSLCTGVSASQMYRPPSNQSELGECRIDRSVVVLVHH